VAIDEEGFRATGVETDATDLPEFSKWGARYDLPNGPRNFYVALQERVASAELEGRVGERLVQYRLTRVRIQAQVLDAYSPEGLLGLGLRRDDLVARDNAVCLELAELARSLPACQGLLVPSAAVAGSANVVIWREAVPETVRVISWMIVTMGYPPPEEATGTAKP